MPRILHVLPAVAPRYGGPSAAILGMCRALDAAGYETVLATTDADGPGRLTVPLESLQTYEGIRTVFFRRQFSEAYKWSRGLGAWLKAHVSEFNLVHIHAVFSHSSILAGRICRKAGVPYIVRPLGTLDPWSVGRKRLRKRMLIQFGAGDLLSGAAAIHYTSPEEQRLAESVFPSLPRGVVVPNGIPESMFGVSTVARSASPYLLSMSRIDEKKGIDLLIRAFQEISNDERFWKWRLVIAGDGPETYVSELMALARPFVTDSRIAFHGWVSGEDKTSLLNDASLFVLPSYQENFGISVAEAMASSVPVLVTRGVNLAADISQARAGWVVDRSIAALTEALRDAMSDRGELERRGRAGRQLAERFHWPVIASELIAVYDEIMLKCAA
jgi:glycosyltransferase involved in cell wall biosynthesis